MSYQIQFKLGTSFPINFSDTSFHNFVYCLDIFYIYLKTWENNAIYDEQHSNIWTKVTNLSECQTTLLIRLLMNMLWLCLFVIYLWKSYSNVSFERFCKHEQNWKARHCTLQLVCWFRWARSINTFLFPVWQNCELLYVDPNDSVPHF